MPPLPAYPMLGGEIPIDSSDDTNRRRILFYIIWTCLTIIFLLRMMMICLVAPELPLGFAARRYVVARWFARTYGVSLTRAFFWAMSGFVTRDSHHPMVIRASPQFGQYFKKMARRVRDCLSAVPLGDHRNSDPMAASVPPFWSSPFGEGPRNFPLVPLFQLICAILFGVVHCLAWNTSFPSRIEMWMWRISALLITGLPLLFFLLLLLCNLFEHGNTPRRVLTYFIRVAGGQGGKGGDSHTSGGMGGTGGMGQGPQVRFATERVESMTINFHVGFSGGGAAGTS